MRRFSKLLLVMMFLGLVPVVYGQSSCAAPANPIVAENCLAGTDPNVWDISGAGADSIRGFATNISVNRGTSVSFKIDTIPNTGAYTIDIYRLGYYGGKGARLVTSLSNVGNQNQPACLQDATTGLIDCGNWAVSATWNVPASATSGIYFAMLKRTDSTAGESHIFFVVRDDRSHSAILYQASDTAWQAYNNYGGNSLYEGQPDGRAYKVSYNRPFTTASATNSEDWLLNAEYPMVRWLEANGYDITYSSDTDSDRNGSLILNHKVFLSVGHDEYWSAAQRANVTAARDAGVNLAFFSGNELFWKTRWENSIDGTNTPFRTLVCYKETHANAKIDPLPNVWTGTWRDPRFSPPADGGRPENSLSGTIFMVNGYRSDSIVIPWDDGRMRFWRNTAVAGLPTGGSYTMPAGTLGYEWDQDLDNGSRPAGLFHLSTATVSGVPLLQDYGSTYASGTATHNSTLYRAPSGALVFGAGTVQWSWGLDANHQNQGPPTDINMQQATVNLLADMGAQTGTLQPGLVTATASTDTTPPTASINFPSNNGTVRGGSASAITGTAADAGGGVVGGVEVSTDNGATWHPATGRESWSYKWSGAATGTQQLLARAVDDSGNLGAASATVTVTVNSLTDTTAPTVSSVTPANGSTNVVAGVVLTAVFSEPLDPSTVNTTTFDLRNSSNVLIPAGVVWDAAARTARLYPTTQLAFSTTFTATLHGGSTGNRLRDYAGNSLASNVTWSFTTQAQPPPPDEGPGGPVMVIGTVSNPFGRYVGEILRAEGLNHYTVTDISLVTATRLSSVDVAILGEMTLTSSQVTMFTNFVNAGGKLIVMRPGSNLAGLLGLTTTASKLSNAYLLINTASGPGVGIVNQTIQYHGQADQYTLSGATSLATLYSNATTATANPAVTLMNVGASGGQAAAFTFDLARSVVYTRQGNPAWSGQERDGITPIRSDDLYFGAAAGNPQPDWVDLSKVAIPQADEQQRLLANMIIQMEQSKQPLPRFWYFPFGKKAVVVMTGDDHANGGTSGRFDHYIALSPQGCSVANWECIRSTSYIYPSNFLTNAQAASYTALGFEVAAHITTNCADFTSSTLDGFFSGQLGTFRFNYPSLATPTTNRTHCVVWSDYDTQPQIELRYGIRLDTTYYYYPGSWVANRPGFFTGSGMPMRYAKLDGTIVDVYQSTSQITDESNQEQPFTSQQLLNNALGTTGYYGAFTANMHTDVVASTDSEALVQTALPLGVPIVSAKQMLTWLDARNGSSFTNFSWNGFTLSFTINAASGSTGLQAMVPGSMPVGALTGITRNLVPVNYTLQTIKGMQYAFFDASAGGNIQATYKIDIVPPVISNLQVATADGGQATISWTTNEPSTSRVDYGTASNALNLNAGNSALVTAHSITLSGLAFNTTYYFRVTSADASANSATFPAAGNPPASFTMPPPRFHDTTVADFSAGAVPASIALTDEGDGEVILSPLVNTVFPGTSLPSDWTSAIWNTGGGATVSNGVLFVDGARAGTTGTYTPGHTMEFTGTFSGAAFQHVGFGLTYNEGLWAMFSTWGGGSNLYARTNNGTTSNDVLIPGSYVGAVHDFRIDWTATQVVFWIDGVQKLVQPIAISSNMRPLASDYIVGGGGVTLRNVRMTPYSGSGTFQSRVYDAAGTATWGVATWQSNQPAGTSIAMSYRTGDTPVPDASWTSFTAIPSSGASLGTSSRYIQYQAVLSTSDPAATPDLDDVSIIYSGPAPDTTPPAITGRTPPAGATGVAVGSNVTATFSEALAPATVSNATVHLRAAGASSDVAATVSYSNRVITLTPGSSLSLGTQYTATISGSVTDLAGNPMGADAVWSFTTTAGASLRDVTAADFNAGTPGANTVVVSVGDGEVILNPAVEAEFNGSALPANFFSSVWTSGGTVNVGGGLLVVDGSLAGTNAFTGPGSSLEFAANFSGDSYEHVGFGTDFSGAPWAMFSTMGGGGLYARTTDGNNSNNIQIPGSWLGATHRYRIDWAAGSVTFSIDGVVVSTQAINIGGTMRPLISDYLSGGGNVSVDWLRQTPYPGSGTFTSRVFDAGSAVTWDTASWNAVMPANTSLALSFRTGNTSVPDASWTSFAPVAGSGGSLGGSARYIQYSVTLGTTDSTQTPMLQDVTLNYHAGP